MGKILIKNGRVWDGEKFSFNDILIEDNIVKKIDSNIIEDSAYNYDASGKIVSSGLVDAHAHILLDPSDEFGFQAEMCCFPFGVTAAADAGRTKGKKEILDTFMLKNVIFANVHFKDNKVDYEDLNNTLNRFNDKVVGVKVYYDSTGSEKPNINLLKEVCEFANKQNLHVMVHCSNSPSSMKEILDALHPGDILTHVYHGGVNNASIDNFESVMEAKERGVIMDAGFAGHVHTNFSVLYQAFKNNVFPHTISTDITKFSAFTRGGRYGMTMCMSIALDTGMKEEEIFKAITSSPAKALGKENEWGYLKEGRIADIAVFDYTNEPYSLTDNEGNHIENDSGYRCVLTISNGQIVYRY